MGCVYIAVGGSDRCNGRQRGERDAILHQLCLTVL